MLGELNADQIEHVLRSEIVGRIGCHAEGRTYVVPVTYVYDGQHIFGHTREGMKTRFMRENPDVCFEVDRMDNLANWESVIVWGTYEELHGKAANAAMDLLINRFMPLLMSETALPAHALHPSGKPIDTSDFRGVVYRITITEKTGRFECNELAAAAR